MPPFSSALLGAEALRRELSTLTLVVLVFGLSFQDFARITRHRIQAAKLSTVSANSRKISAVVVHRRPLRASAR
jgi:hypothetical protein